MKIKVEITEILQRTVEVDADDINAAVKHVKELYKNEEIILDSGDYISTEFNVIE